MTSRFSTEQSTHDNVVRTCLNTYRSLQEQGYKVDINPGSEKNRLVRPSNPLYPDVVVWKPEYPGSTKGQAEIIEEVETSSSVTPSEASQWRDLGSLGVKFILTVPQGSEDNARKIVNDEKVRLDELWNYRVDESGNVVFAKVAL